MIDRCPACAPYLSGDLPIRWRVCRKCEDRLDTPSEACSRPPTPTEYHGKRDRLKRNPNA